VKKAMAAPIADIDLRKVPVLEGFDTLSALSGVKHLCGC